MNPYSFVIAMLLLGAAASLVTPLATNALRKDSEILSNYAVGLACSTGIICVFCFLAAAILGLTHEKEVSTSVTVFKYFVIDGYAGAMVLSIVGVIVEGLVSLALHIVVNDWVTARGWGVASAQPSHN